MQSANVTDNLNSILSEHLDHRGKTDLPSLAWCNIYQQFLELASLDIDTYNQARDQANRARTPLARLTDFFTTLGYNEEHTQLMILAYLYDLLKSNLDQLEYPSASIKLYSQYKETDSDPIEGTTQFIINYLNNYNLFFRKKLIHSIPPSLSWYSSQATLNPENYEAAVDAFNQEPNPQQKLYSFFRAAGVPEEQINLQVLFWISSAQYESNEPLQKDFSISDPIEQSIDYFSVTDSIEQKIIDLYPDLDSQIFPELIAALKNLNIEKIKDLLASNPSVDHEQFILQMLLSEIILFPLKQLLENSLNSFFSCEPPPSKSVFSFVSGTPPTDKITPTKLQELIKELNSALTAKNKEVCQRIFNDLKLDEETQIKCMQYIEKMDPQAYYREFIKSERLINLLSQANISIHADGLGKSWSWQAAMNTYNAIGANSTTVAFICRQLNPALQNQDVIQITTALKNLIKHIHADKIANKLTVLCCQPSEPTDKDINELLELTNDSTATPTV